jgi:hypothetical protein
MVSGMRILRASNAENPERADSPPSRYRASEGTLLRVKQCQPCVARSAKQGGGDGLLSSPRRYSFSEELDISSDNSSSCTQVFHREPDSPRPKIIDSAGACTPVPRCARRAPFQQDPAVAPARARRAGFLLFADWMKSELRLDWHAPLMRLLRGARSANLTRSCRLAVALCRACAASGGRFEHHSVGGIPQERPPHEMAFDRFDHGENRIDEYPDLVRGKSSCNGMLGAPTCGLVFECQGYVRQQRYLA